MWRGATTRANAAAYARYVAETGLVGYRATPGNRGAHVLQRDVGELTEIVTLSFWDSLDAIKSFAGENVETAVFYARDDDYLVERDLHVTHFRMTDD
jgi:heme-degrading monooxygenase HmoA